jgi:GxxExxY protein
MCATSTFNWTGLTGLNPDKEHTITEKIIGCAMKVHRTLGPGFLESVYRNALVHELRRAGFSAEIEQRITVRYENVVVGEFLSDLIVNDELLCELKAISSLSKADEVQLVNYLVATNRDFGLLINFGTRSLQFKRKYRQPLFHAADVDLREIQNPVNPVNPV